MSITRKKLIKKTQKKKQKCVIRKLKSKTQKCTWKLLELFLQRKLKKNHTLRKISNFIFFNVYGKT